MQNNRPQTPEVPEKPETTEEKMVNPENTTAAKTEEKKPETTEQNKAENKEQNKEEKKELTATDKEKELAALKSRFDALYSAVKAFNENKEKTIDGPDGEDEVEKFKSEFNSIMGQMDGLDSETLKKKFPVAKVADVCLNLGDLDLEKAKDKYKQATGQNVDDQIASRNSEETTRQVMDARKRQLEYYDYAKNDSEPGISYRHRPQMFKILEACVFDKKGQYSPQQAAYLDKEFMDRMDVQMTGYEHEKMTNLMETYRNKKEPVKDGKARSHLPWNSGKPLSEWTHRPVREPKRPSIGSHRISDSEKFLRTQIDAFYAACPTEDNLRLRNRLSSLLTVARVLSGETAKNNNPNAQESNQDEKASQNDKESTPVTQDRLVAEPYTPPVSQSTVAQPMVAQTVPFPVPRETVTWMAVQVFNKEYEECKEKGEDTPHENVKACLAGGFARIIDIINKIFKSDIFEDVQKHEDLNYNLRLNSKEQVSNEEQVSNQPQVSQNPAPTTPTK